MKKFIKFILSILMIFTIASCGNKEVKENITPELVISAYENTSYSTFGHQNEVDNFKYTYSVKVYNSENETSDYIFIYFFLNNEDAKDFVKENNSKRGVIFFFSIIFGEATKAKWTQYDYMVVESTISKAKSQVKDMINIYESVIY